MISNTQFLEMQARCERVRNARENSANSPHSNQKEIGKGGIQDEIEQWMKDQIPLIWWDLKRTDVPTTSRLGVVDFVGTFKGVPFGIEVKRPGQKTTPEQDGQLLWMRMAGAQTKIAHSKDEAVEFLLGLKKP